jgi:NTP pyrophosphatase (non-canonical NTP hydrolase)
MTEAEEMRKYAEARECGELRLPKLTDEQLKKLKDMIEHEPAYIHTEMDSPVRPLPCVQDEHGEIRGQTVKRLFAKINEELDELKAAVLREVTTRNNLDDLADGVDDDTDTDIAEEAADTITAITTMLEALGIDVDMRDEAQRRVNEKNLKRNRL